MNSVFKRITVIISAFALMILCIVSVSAGDTETPAKGDIIEFGSYPQTCVTDEDEITKLNECITDAVWQSAEYYASNEKVDIAKYCDFEYEGEMYRAFIFTDCRPVNVYKSIGVNSWLPNRGYTEDTVYFFKFEPLEWTVANPTTGLLVCLNGIDSMPITNTAYAKSWNYEYKDAEFTVYANNYEKSDIRTWLNSTFINTAFTEKQQNAIKVSEVTNESYKTAYSAYASGTVNDKIFLPSLSDYLAVPTAQRQKAPTDYAIVNGNANYTSVGGNYATYTFWFLRGPGDSGKTMAVITPDGDLDYSMDCVATDTATVPALCVDFELMNIPEDHTYDNFTFSYEDGILTVGGTGVLPDSALSTDKPLDAFAGATILILEDGITGVDSGAFAGFNALQTVIINGEAKISADSFPDSTAVKDIILFNSSEIEENAFAEITSDLFEWAEYPHVGTLQTGITPHICSYADETVTVTGSLTMNAYRMLDIFTVLCTKCDTVNYFAFEEFTSENIMFCTADKETGDLETLEEQTLKNAVLSIRIKNGTEYNSASFNELVELASSDAKFTFMLEVKADNADDIEDTRINVISRYVYLALKFIVNLLNKLFKLFSKLK